MLSMMPLTGPGATGRRWKYEPQNCPRPYGFARLGATGHPPGRDHQPATGAAVRPVAGPPDARRRAARAGPPARRPGPAARRAALAPRTGPPLGAPAGGGQAAVA